MKTYGYPDLKDSFVNRRPSVFSKKQTIIAISGIVLLSFPCLFSSAKLLPFHAFFPHTGEK